MIPLYDHESEKWLIGALLTDAEVQKQLPTLPPEMMHDPLNEKILSCMRRLQERRAPIEPLSVQSALRDAGEPDMAGYLIDCMRFTVTGASAGHYIARLKGFHRARSAYAMASAFCQQLIESGDVDACTDALRTALRGLDAPSGRIVRMDELASGVYDDIERRSRGEIPGIVTQIPDLDRLIFCLEPGDLAVIGARPAVGKSAFGMQIALNAARQGRHVLVCSREMRQMQYGHRIASHVSGINGARLRRGALSQEEWGELAGCCGEMGRLPLAFAFDSATAVFAPYSSATSSTMRATASNTSLLDASMEHCKRPSGINSFSSPAMARGLSQNDTASDFASTTANEATFCDGFGRMA